MVLAELGSKITSALEKLKKASVVDEKFFEGIL